LKLMRRSLWSKAIAATLAHALMASSFVVLAQDAPQTRPRRVQAPAQPATQARAEVTRMSNEPLIRIGLATDARSVTISSGGRLLSITEPGAPLAPLAVARVRLEARLLAPRPEMMDEDGYRVELARMVKREDALQAAREIREATGAEATVTQDAATNSWLIQVGSNLSASKAAELRAQLEDAGFATAMVVDEKGAQGANARSTQAAAAPRPSIASVAPPS
jgi:hypothetical protein